MFWYLAVFALLLALALIEKNRNWPGVAAAVILALMCGLRYETGFDWVEYEAHYLYAPGLFDDDIYASVTTFTVEPGFEFLNSALRTIGADFQWLIFIVGAFNLAVLYCFARRFSPLVAVVLIWYYGFVFLNGQMATMRSAMSVSFIYLAYMARNDDRVVRAAVMGVLAILFHVFAAIFAAMVFVTLKAPRARWYMLTGAIGFLAAGIGGNLFVPLVGAVLGIVDGGLVAEKLQIYGALGGTSISPLSFALVAFHVLCVWLIQRKGDDSYIEHAAMWAAFVSVVFHSFFAAFPILWSRAMLVAFPLEAIALCRVFAPELRDTWSRSRFVAVAAFGSLMALVYGLSNAQALVYKPYQNLAVVWLRGPYGDGRVRYQVIRNVNNALLAEQKAK